MSDEYGAGIALDGNFDLSVGKTGDLKHTEELAEVEKDLSANMAAELSDYIGSIPTPGLKSEILSDAAITAELDERVARVNKEESSVSFEDDNSITVQLSVVLNTNEEYQLVFNV